MKKLLITIFLIFSILSTFYIKIKYYGVSIDNFRFNSYYVEELFIKWEEKVIIKAHTFQIGPVIQENKNFDIKETINYIFEVLSYFDLIEIENLIINGVSHKISYNKEKFYLDNDFINITAIPKINNHIITLDIHTLFFKQYDILTLGMLQVDLDNEMMNYFGDFSYGDIIGELSFNATKEYLDFFIDTKGLKDIKFIKSFIDLDDTIELWMYDSVFGEYQLGYLKGRIDLKNQQLLTNTLEGKASVKNAKIRFHKNLDFVETQNIEVLYQNDILSFNLEKPLYKNISIDGSFVEISDMLGDNPTLLVNLSTNYILEENILNILKAYDIEIPVLQKSGTTDAIVMLKIDLNNGKLTSSGQFDIINSFVNIGELEFYTSKAKVILEDTIIKVNDFEASIDNFLQINGNLTINTKTKIIEGFGNINKFLLNQENTSLLKIENKDTQFSYDFQNDKLTLDGLKLTLQKLSDKSYHINIADIVLLKPYIQNIDLSNIKQGGLFIHFITSENIHFKTNLTLFESLLYKNDEMVLDYQLNGSYVNKLLTMQNENSDFIFTINHNDINITLDSYDIMYKNNNEDSKEDSNKYNIYIKSTNGNLHLSNRKILSEGFEVSIKNGITKFTNKYLNTNLEVIKTKQNTTIRSSNLNDTFINTFLNKNIIKDGTIYVNLISNENNNDIFSGEIYLKDTNLQNVKFLNTLLTFVETSPAIINPLLAIPSAYRAIKDGAIHDAYMVKNGILKITYDTDNEFLNIYEGYLEGSRSDLSGSIAIDTKHNTIDGNVNVVILKDYTNIVQNIPVVGYIFLGEDKNVIVSTKISGSLDHPQVETFATKDATKGGVNILKRILTSPLKIFE